MRVRTCLYTHMHANVLEKENSLAIEKSKSQNAKTPFTPFRKI